MTPFAMTVARVSKAVLRLVLREERGAEALRPELEGRVLVVVEVLLGGEHVLRMIRASHFRAAENALGPDPPDDLRRVEVDLDPEVHRVERLTPPRPRRGPRTWRRIA